ncbi:trypsin-like serine protease [Leptospira ryugenii]|uniref:Trypsin-like serine protease n=1 Tax=Leptospira ryugenii TaxID=1917863 RepID=A0A2P2E0B8_9LEPT|nr:trypsin-like peptidase domain-containing protein [Leptospira ryugenii]GBF50256.1 trypsin-like serine protease [Leptospira ryugenii]
MNQAKTNPLKYIAIASSFLLLGTFLSPILTCGDSQSNNPLQLKADSTDKLSPAQLQAVTLEDAFQEVFEKASPSVVSIATERRVNRRQGFPSTGDPFFDHLFGRQGLGGGKVIQEIQNGLGSGIILNDEGYILTNHHVIDGMDKLTVKLRNKNKYNAKLIGTDATIDVALLKIEAPKSELVPIRIGNSDKVKVGNWAIAIGAPLGLEYSFTVGVVSAVQRGGIDESGLAYIQTDTAINQGNSGGPLLNIKGEVIGINRMILSQSGGSEGIGLTIPINEAKRVAEQLKTDGRVSRPWIGVSLSPINKEIADQLGLSSTEGAVVVERLGNSPAAKAGLRPSDVIIEIDGKPIKSPSDVQAVIASSKIGKRIEIKIIRNKNEVLTTITPEQKPN